MKVSELIAALEQAKAQHGDLEAGYYSSPGAMSFGVVTEVEPRNTEWRKDRPARPALVLWNDNPA